jgi:NAD(P)-dependent dehydrogenase (short-subunit alcohol dehydrogenase family)
MTITFITGANKGLGFEMARRLINLGQTVIIGARDPERGVAAAEKLGAGFVPIDVTDDASVAAAAEDIRDHEGHIDTLINNAGITGRRAAADELTGDDAMLVFQTNVVSIVRTTSAFLPQLRKSPAPAIINVPTSGSTPPTPATPPPTSTATAAPRRSPRARTRSSCWRPRAPRRARGVSSTASAPSTGSRHLVAACT